MSELNNIPRWNMDSIFSSIDCDEYKSALKDFEQGIANLSELVAAANKFMRESHDNFDFCAWLSSYLDQDCKVITLSRTLNAYAYAIYSTDTTNTDYLNNISKVEDISINYDSITLAFKTLLVAHTKYLDEFYSRYPKYEEYRYLIDNMIDDTRHQMTPAEEKLASELQRTGADAWDRLHEQIISNLKDDKSGKTFNEIRNDAYSPDAALRKESYETELKLLKQHEIACAASLNNIKGATVTLNKKRHWDQAIDKALAAGRLSRKTLDALIKAIEDSLPDWRRYFALKAKYLQNNGLTVSKTAGTQGNPGLAFYDLFAPLSVKDDGNKDSLLSKTWTFDEAKSYILDRYNSFSKAMGDFALYAFDNNWIDGEVREGKVGGAYDEDFPLGHQSRILTNFTGAFSDIITLAHELGHAYHFSCLKGKDSIFFDYPMTLAETASTFAETIVKQDMLSKSSGNDKVQILELDLQDSSQVLVDILSRFYFERSVFAKRAEGELSAEDFNALMKKAQDDSYGCGLSKDERHEYMWAVKSHYYSADLDFYNFPYAFGQLFAAGLYSRYKAEGNAFAETYASLLSDTGSMSCEDLCKKAGFDITTPEFWKTGIQMYIDEINELEKLLK